MTATMAVIFFLSHQPQGTFELPQFAGGDKLVHVFVYAILAASVLFALHPFINDSRRKSGAMLVLLFCLLYGITDEFHQSFIPGRVVSVWDVAADFFGALVVVFCWYRQEVRYGTGKYS
jgi:VanZ family protein